MSFNIVKECDLSEVKAILWRMMLQLIQISSHEDIWQGRGGLLCLLWSYRRNEWINNPQELSLDVFLVSPGHREDFDIIIFGSLLKTKWMKKFNSSSFGARFPRRFAWTATSQCAVSVLMKRHAVSTAKTKPWVAPEIYCSVIQESSPLQTTETGHFLHQFLF